MTRNGTTSAGNEARPAQAGQGVGGANDHQAQQDQAELGGTSVLAVHAGPFI
ncbi:MAG: hypothetical protein IPN02_08525 [Candidatus Microthrix sp.]|uniref:Uncharacterized protein n=1 Tax=Candidatus Neomicrothrix subdominans TaxID=2954438 RepID=A0A936NAV2_9ACTN|nr:hypothetical protein [Candidatus Microthrix subdominans]